MTSANSPAKAPFEPLYTIDEVAAALRLSRNNAYTKREQDDWPHHKIGNKILFTAADWEAIQASYEQQPASPPYARRTRRTRR